MSIDEQPMNVYWSGKRTETINRSKINYKGSVATFSDLPDTNNQEGDMYSVTGLNGENYIWDGTAWDSLGTSDANVVHKTGAETISGNKTFGTTIVTAQGAVKKTSDSDYLLLCGGSTNTTANGARLEIYGSTYASTPGIVKFYTGKVDNSFSTFTAYPDGTLTWNGQSIQTSSDERLKTSLASVPDEVLDAWEEVCWGQFRFLNAIERKGDAARLHLGLIAQRVKAVFEKHGLNACAYGILCHEEHEASTIDVDGKTVTVDAVDLWMVRYAEAQAMESAYQRRRADRAEARIKALEDRLEVLEAKLA